MNSIKRRNLLTLLVVGLFSLTMVVVPSVNGTINSINNNEFSIKATDVFVEDFEDTTYRDGASTAIGWGTGTVTNARYFTWKELDFQESKYALTDIDVEGKRVYATSYNTTSASPSMVVFDISNTYDIRQTGERNSFAGQMSIAADGDVVYVGQDYTGVASTINTYYWTNPFSGGSWVSTTSADGSVTDIELNGHLAYYTSFNSTSGYSLRVLYAENPDVPINITASWMDSSKALGLAVESNLAYVAAEEDGFYVVNVSNINNFFTEGFVDTPGIATDVVLDGRYAYLAAGDEGIFSIDIIDKTNPQIIGHIDTPGHARKLVLQGNTLFVADGSGVVVLDVADPNNPTFVTSMTITPYVYDVDLFGGTLVVGSADGLHTYTIQAGDGIADISETCYENSYFDRQAWDVRVRGDLAFVAGGS
ncbi:MAG: LVIVD repeat-containing protein, partial [Candidatus Heimdallarchaeota archaeon]